jgi:hypothetical protein
MVTTIVVATTIVKPLEGGKVVGGSGKVSAVQPSGDLPDLPGLPEPP